MACMMACDGADVERRVPTRRRRRRGETGRGPDHGCRDLPSRVLFQGGRRGRKERPTGQGREDREGARSGVFSFSSTICLDLGQMNGFPLLFFVGAFALLVLSSRAKFSFFLVLVFSRFFLSFFSLLFFSLFLSGILTRTNVNGVITTFFLPYSMGSIHTGRSLCKAISSESCNVVVPLLNTHDRLRCSLLLARLRRAETTNPRKNDFFPSYWG